MVPADRSEPSAAKDKAGIRPLVLGLRLTIELDLDAYLRRTGARAPLAPSAEALTDLQRAHIGAIPFENLDILLGRPIPLDLGSLQDKLVAARRGGYCFEQNTLFRAVLERLGFTVTSLAARVRAGATGVRARTHMLLQVELSEPQAYREYPEVWQRRAGGKDSPSTRSDFRHGLLGPTPPSRGRCG